MFGSADAFIDQRLALGRVAFPLADLVKETGLSVTAARCWSMKASADPNIRDLGLDRFIFRFHIAA